MADEASETEEEEAAAVETPRELTLEETHSPIISTMGEQAVGAVDLGEGRFQPTGQEIQTSELITPGESILDPVQRGITPSTIAEDPAGFTTEQVLAPSAVAKASQVEGIERTFTQLPTDVIGAQGAVSTGAIVDIAQIVDERTKQQMVERGSLAEAKTQTLAQEATVQFQIEALYESLEEEFENDNLDEYFELLKKQKNQ